MSETITALFERALEDEPVPPPGDLAGAAMADGARIRRRRRLTAGSAVAAVAVALTAGTLALLPGGPPPSSPAGAAPGCYVVAYLLDDVTDAQRVAVSDYLRADPHVAAFAYESKETAIQRFHRMWPDVKKVPVTQLPESFRVGLADGADHRALDRALTAIPGVADVTNQGCS
jgi:cell division protein FtsX